MPSPPNAGSSRKAKLLSRGGRERLQALALSPVQSRQREQWLGLIDQLTARINELERELESLSGRDARVGRLRTHPGIGLLTGLALAHTLSPVGPLQLGPEGRGLSWARAVRALLGRQAAVGRDQQGRLSAAALLVGRGGAERRARRPGVAGLLSALGLSAWPPEGAHGGGAQVAGEGLHPAA